MAASLSAGAPASSAAIRVGGLAGPVAQVVQRPTLVISRVIIGDGAARERATVDPLQAVEHVVEVSFVNVSGSIRAHYILAYDVGIAVIGVLEAVGATPITVLEPALVHHSAGAVQTRVLVASSANGFGGLFDVSQVHTRFSMRPL